MNGNVFQCPEEQRDGTQYAKTVEALDAYVKKTLTYSADLAPLFAAKHGAPTVALPVEVAASAGELARMIFQGEVKEYVKRTRALQSNLAAIYAVIWGQCSEDMQARVKTNEAYEPKSVANNCAWLLNSIRSVTSKFDSTKFGFMSPLEAQYSFLSCKQEPGQSPDKYAANLVGWAETIETHGGTVSANHELVPEQDTYSNLRTTVQRQVLPRERTLATALIRNADPTKYGTLITDLANQYAMGRDDYPADIATAKGLLTTYRAPVNAPTRAQQHSSNRGQPNSAAPATPAPEASALTFAQNAFVPGTNGLTHEDVDCWTCHSFGHYSRECPTGRATAAGTTLAQLAYMLAQANGNIGIDPSWILLDSQ
jgi:hypothetical protein